MSGLASDWRQWTERHLASLKTTYASLGQGGIRTRDPFELKGFQT